MRMVLSSSATTGHAGRRASSPLSVSAIASGNSLMDPIFTGGEFGNRGVSWLINEYAGSVVSAIAKSTQPGTSMIYRWENPTAEPDAKTLIADYELLIITDVSTSFNTTTYGPTQEALPANALLWANHTWEIGAGGEGGEIILWCPNARTDIPDIAAQYAKRFELWAGIQDYCNARLPAGRKPVRLIPGAWLWHKFWLDQQAGNAPTATWYDDLFIDEVHPGGVSPYIFCLLIAVCVYGIDPYLLADSIPNIQAPTPAELEYIRSNIKSLAKNFLRGAVDTTAWA